MKLLLWSSILMTALMACQPLSPEVQQWIILSGKVTHPIERKINISYKDSSNDPVKTFVRLDDEGNFRDTLKGDLGTTFHFNYGAHIKGLFHAKNHNNIHLSFDNKFALNTLQFGEDHAKFNNFLFKVAMAPFFLRKELDYNLPKDSLSMLVARAFGKMKKEKQGYEADYPTICEEIAPYLATALVRTEESIATQTTTNQLAGQALEETIFKDPAGNDFDLNSLKGQYVYIDFWASWCPPCRKEVPHLKRLKWFYNDKNIAFISISMDDESTKDRWLATLKDYKLKKGQYIIDDLSISSVPMQLNINSIPRFVLLDKEGKIIHANCPWPSNLLELQLLFNQLEF